MRLIIVREDNRVIVNGLGLAVDCSSIDPAIHAVQWYGARGEIEYALDEDGAKPANADIEDVTEFEGLIDAWTAAKAARDAANAPPPPPPQPEPEPALTLAQVKAAKLREINQRSARELAAVKEGYPDGEVQSWAKQESEARAFVADDAAATPLLSAIAAARGVPLDVLAVKVIEKADIFAAISGTVIGTRQACEDVLALAATVEDVAAVAWPEASEAA